MNTKKNMNDLICEAMDIVEWEFSKIRSRKELKKAVKLLKKQVEVNSNNYIKDVLKKCKSEEVT